MTDCTDATAPAEITGQIIFFTEFYKHFCHLQTDPVKPFQFFFCIF